MPPILKPKSNVLTKAAEAIKAKSPLPKIVNDALLPTDSGSDVMGIPAGGAIEPAVSAGANLIAPLVSMYKNKAEREAATKAFYDSVVSFARKFMPSGENSAWVGAAQDLINTHPRVAAHMVMDEAPSTAVSNLTGNGGFAAAMNWHPLVHRNGPGELQLHTTSIPEADESLATAREYMKHEATHAAQALGDPFSPELYDLAHKAVGYERNPYERGARYAGNAARQGFQSSAQAPKPLHKQMESVVNKFKRMGISVDRISAGGGRPAEVSLRKWGAAKVPENMVDMQSIDPKLRDQLLKLHQALNSPQLPYSTPVMGSPGKASENMMQILEAKRIGVNGTRMDRAYQRLAKRTGKP